MASASIPSKNCLFVHYSLVDLMDTSHIGFQKVFWGPVPQVGALKVAVLNARVKFFTPQGEARSWGFPPNYVATCKGRGLWQEHNWAFPTCFNVGTFSFIPGVGVTPLLSEFLSEGITPHIAIHLAHPRQEGNSSSLLCHHLGSESNITNINYLSFLVWFEFNFKFIFVL